MSAFRLVSDIGPLEIFDGVIVRPVHGDKLTLGVVELDPDITLPEHRHENEQVGVMLKGSMTFRIGEETQVVTPGATWCINANVPHEVVTGPEGAVVIETFSPPRHDWAPIEPQAPRPPLWP